MRTVNIHEAKTHLSRLVARAAAGESFIIAKDGKPLVRVMAIKAKESSDERIGFLKGEITIPDDFDSMGRAEIADLFGAEK